MRGAETEGWPMVGPYGRLRDVRRGHGALRWEARNGARRPWGSSGGAGTRLAPHPPPPPEVFPVASLLQLLPEKQHDWSSSDDTG